MTKREEAIKQVRDAGFQVSEVTIGEGPFKKSYAFRWVTRKEWREINKETPTTEENFIEAKDIAEEKLVKTALVYPDPEELDFDKLPAGHIPVLAELIMKASGFTGPTEPPKIL